MSNVQMAVGRLLGRTKQAAKQPELVEEWKALCAGQGWKVTDRMLDLIAMDLQQNGLDMALVRGARESSAIAQAADENALATDFIRRIRELSKQVLDVQMSSTRDKQELIAMYEADLENYRVQLRNERVRNEGVREAGREQRKSLSA